MEILVYFSHGFYLPIKIDQIFFMRVFLFFFFFKAEESTLNPFREAVARGQWSLLVQPLCVGEVSGHRVLMKRGPGNRGPTECGTTHEATSGMSS